MMRAQMDSARRAARAAGAVIRERFAGDLSGDVREKGARDFVTEYDLRNEILIKEILSTDHPDVAFLAEETAEPLDADRFWIVDPLDGTTNFIHGYPSVAVSIALWEGGAVVAGCAYDPLRDELFEATRGGGATMNGTAIRVSGRARIEDSLLGTGFPFSAPAHLDDYLGSFRDLFLRCRDIRRAGAAVLDLCHVACGRLDGFWELYLKPWDMAAGALIVEEAGGRATDFFGGPGFLEAGNVVAATPGVRDAIVAVTRSRFTPDAVAPLATRFIRRRA